MKLQGIALGLLCLLLAGCAPISIPTPGCQATLDELSALTQGLEIPEHLQDEDAEKTGKEFDVNQYFSVLTHLAPKPGYVLDYVYFDGSGASWPVIYARQIDDEPFANHTEYLKENAHVKSYDEYMRYIETNGSPEGYFEWVVLAVHGGQFYLGWHANYGDKTVLCSRDAVEHVIEQANDFGRQFTSEDENNALELELEPSVVFDTDTVRVRIVTFTKWGGFYEEVFVISQDTPHRILEHSTEELVPYDCGVVF